MVPGWSCLVFLKSSEQLHGSVFPTQPDQGYVAETFSDPGCEALRVACYSLNHAVKFANVAGANSGRDCRALLKMWKHTIYEKMAANTKLQRLYETRHLPVYVQVKNQVQKCIHA